MEDPLEERYEEWIRFRHSKELVCYCGHTTKCDCGDPSYLDFLWGLDKGIIKIVDDNACLRARIEPTQGPNKDGIDINN